MTKDEKNEVYNTYRQLLIDGIKRFDETGRTYQREVTVMNDMILSALQITCEAKSGTGFSKHSRVHLAMSYMAAIICIYDHPLSDADWSEIHKRLNRIYEESQDTIVRTVAMAIMTAFEEREERVTT